jgi:hypothetical protein
MRLAFQIVFALVSSSWRMIRHAAANADLHHSSELEENEISSIIFSSANHLEDEPPPMPRDLVQAAVCPTGEAWDAGLSRCVVISCQSSKACRLGETCTAAARICAKSSGNKATICPQYHCNSSCPPYEAMDPVTGQCVPMYCSSPNACPATTGKVCLRTPADNCQAGRPCPQFKCCADTRRCSALFCAYGRLNGPDGCPTCDCKPCYGYVGGSGMGRKYNCSIYKRVP